MGYTTDGLTVDWKFLADHNLLPKGWEQRPMTAEQHAYYLSQVKNDDECATTT